MADITQSNHSQTDASNSTAPPDGMPEGQNPSTVNDWARAFIGAVKRWYVWTIPAITAGTTTAYTLSYAVAPGALADGMSHLVQFNATNGATPTLSVNSLGAKPIHKYVGGAWAVCAAGDLPANVVARVSYNLGADAYRITSSPLLFGSALLAVANVFSAANTFSALLTMSGAAINAAKGTDIASVAGITDIGAMIGNYGDVTGTNTPTGLGTIQAGAQRTVNFTGALLLTHNATSLILPNAGANITTAAGDVAEFVSLGSGNWKCTKYQRANGASLALNRAYAEYLTCAVLAPTIPADDTKPQVGEGTEILSVAITPRNTTSRVRARVQAPVGLGSGGSPDTACMALFRNGGADAIDSTSVRLLDGSSLYAAILEFEDVPASVSAQTYSVRVGANTAAVSINGVAGNRFGGGTSRATLILEEIPA